MFEATGMPVPEAGRAEFRDHGASNPGLDRAITDVLAGWAERRPAAVALRMTSVEASREWTYRRLWDRVCQIKDNAFADLDTGARVVMAMPDDADYLAGFFAALAAGLIPVPVYLPPPEAPGRFLARAQHILADCQPSAIYTAAELAGALESDGALARLAIRTPDTAATGDGLQAARRPLGDGVAFLQYTSGSTGEPKGIVNTHAAILNQLRIGKSVWDRPDDDIRTVSWLPLYHDMGMFWGVLLPLLSGGSATLISPYDFIRHPRIWLETVAAVRGNWIGGPDFGYRRCIDAFDDAAVDSLDLSCLQLATNGAEPVRVATLHDFTDKFRPAGLRADAMAPKYGLAEAGLVVSGPGRRRRWVQGCFDADELNLGRAVAADSTPGGNRRSRTLVSCGDATFGWDVRIVDPERRTVVADGAVGEVWVAGAGLPQGYWRRPQHSAAAFHAATADGRGPYLRTGDAGFYSDGELYICGRYRDLIIVGGANYFPNDIEATVEAAHCGVEVGGACAVQPDDPQPPDAWWLVAETDAPADDLADLARVLRRSIVKTHQTAPERIVWVRRRALPRTTSGKIRRHDTATMLTAGRLDVITETAARPNAPGTDRAVTELAEHVAGLLGVRADELDADAELTEKGLTSVMTADVVEWSAARSRRLDFADLYAQPTLRNWQRCFDTAAPAPPDRSRAAAAATVATTALQRAYWVGRGDDQPLGGVGCQTYFELAGAEIDADRLDDALDVLARRHPMLRSTFPDAVECRIAPDTLHAPVRVHDLTGVDDAARQRHLDATRDRLSANRFDIASGDTWRVELSRGLGGDVVHLAIDLIIADLTGITVLLRDLAALYRGEQLPPVSTTFAELAETAPPAAAGSVERLPEGPALPGVDERGIAFDRRQHTLDPAAMRRLDAACRANGVMRAAVFLAAYEAVLRRWSQTDDFLINVTTFGRPPGTADVVGDFTKTRLYRTGAEVAPGFAAAAAGAQHRLRAALAGPESVDALAGQLRAGTGHSGLAPVVFTYAADTPVVARRDLATLGDVGEVRSRTPQVLIDNQTGAVADDLVVSWDYRAGCFPPGVVDDMFGAYVGLLEALGDRDWAAPAGIALPEHTRRTRRDRNATAAPRPDGPLYDAFRRIAETDPTRIAVRWQTAGNQRDPIAATSPHLTYSRLDQLARSVAGALAERHTPGAVIGIQLPKGPGQIVAVLGVLMAGCSYLPVGIDTPAERLERICARSAMAGLIRSGQKTETADTAGADGPGVYDLEALTTGPPVTVPVRVAADETAYVIYTSGSTGEPKGVMITHAAAANTIADVNRRNRIGDTDTLLAVSELDFDLSVYDIFGPLSCGASMVAIFERHRRDAFAWNALVTELGVSVWNSVPGLVDMLLIAAGDRNAALPSLRSVFLSGDWIPLDVPERLRRAAPAARLVSMGGATEAAIWSNEFVVGDVDPEWTSVPYGYPLANQAFRVVDGHGADRPDHVAGKLWIGGAGVARGYHNAPELTAQRFVCDDAGTRWYRTGDLGCYWPDGTLQFLGRADAQVKIRGHRIECGEIEHALRTHPSIDSAAVVAINNATALGAIVVCGRHTTKTKLPETVLTELGAHLAARLPPYMLPRSCIARDRLPLTGNGKLDRRRATAEIEADRQAAPAGVPGPAGELSRVERIVAEVWSQVLATAITTRDDNFFQHGGDSLRATQATALLGHRGIRDARVGDLLGRQTLGEFSAGCTIGDADPGAEPGAGAAALGAASPTNELPLTRLQQAYVLGSAGMNGATRAPTHFAIVLAPAADAGRIDLDRFKNVAARCVEEFAMLRCALETDATQRLHAPGAPVAVTVAADAADDPDALMAQMAAAAFEPRATPVLRCFASPGPGRHVGVLINYLSLDARSLAAVLAAIIADYQATPRPRPVDPEAGIFARYVGEHRDGRDDAAPAGAEAQPAGPPALPLCDDRPDSTTRVGFARSSFTLDAGAARLLRDRAADWRATPTALIFEAFTHALHAIGAGQRFAVVVPKSHRPDYAPIDREVLGNFTRLALCETDYRATTPGSVPAVAAAQRQLWRAVDDEDDATGHLARLRSGGSAGHPVVFTSTLGLVSQAPAELVGVRALTQTPGVWLDCQVEDDRGGIRVSWDTAAGIIADDALAAAFAHLEDAVRQYAGPGHRVGLDQPAAPGRTDAPPAHPPRPPKPQPGASGWAGGVIAAAARRCHPDRVRPEYAALVGRWRQTPHPPAAGDDTARAAGRLAEIAVGAASPQTLIGDPQLSPEAMLLADDRLGAALDELGDRVFDHSRRLGRRLRILEVGSRTGLITGRLTAAIGAVAEQYLCFEPNRVLAEIAAARSISTPTRHLTTREQLAAEQVDVVVCCGSLHQLAEPQAVLEAATVADGGWLWLAEHCEATAATLASAAVLNPALLSTEAAPRPADQWWRFVAEHRWRPAQMTQDGPGVTIIAHRHPRLAAANPAPRQANPATRAPAPEPAVVDESVLATVAGIWQRHLSVATPTAGDDFFLLGGDSLVATRVYADLHAAGFSRLALVDLFNYPVLGELAARAGTPSVAPGRPEPARGHDHDETEFPLTVVQHAYLAGRRGGFMLGGVAAHCYFEFESADLDAQRFATAATRLIQRHPGLRTTVAPAAPDTQASRRTAVVDQQPIEPIVAECDDVRARMRDQIIDIAARPGIELGIETRPDGRRRIGISMDNAMLDGASMMIALVELDHLYRGDDVGQLPQLPTSFAHYAWSHPELWPDADEAALPQLAAARDYWRARLASLPPAPKLAAMSTMLDIETPVFERAAAAIAPTDWDRIGRSCRAEGVTPASFLLANYARVLAQWSGSDHFCLNVTLFDRDPAIAGIEHVIGDFTSLLLLECRIDTTATIFEQARRLQRQLLTDLPHRAADAVWLQRELLHHHGRPAAAVFPVVFTSGLGLVDTSARSSFGFGEPVFAVSQTPQTVLDFQMWERAGALMLSWDFVTQAIDAQTARGHLDALVANMTAVVDPAEPSAAAPGAPAPGDDFVERVARICAAALELPQIDAGDNFFLLGGDSVTATKVVEHTAREISAAATLRLLFENPVIGDFAARLRSAAPDGVDPNGADPNGTDPGDTAIEEGVL